MLFIEEILDQPPLSIKLSLQLQKFVEDFVCELSNVIQDGFHCDGRHVDITLKYFLCDVAATVLLKAIISHTSYKSSERCCVDGIYVAHVAYLMEKLSTLSQIGKYLKILDTTTH